nr:EOG090X0G3U [Eulimnadia texana]
MSERKVLNKYYPPDFDPTKIPRVKQEKNRQFTVRLMAPFNMRCKTCGEYIYKGKKFNARKEDVENETYYGVRIYRFYIKCTRCLSEISFKTDPASTDYVIEAGATRNFMALKLAEEAAKREIEQEKEEERLNPMKLLENRTKASRNEIETVEALEELKEMNKRKIAVNYETILEGFQTSPQVDIRTQEMEDEALIKSVFGEKTEDGKVIKRLPDSDSDEDVIMPTPNHAHITLTKEKRYRKCKDFVQVRGFGQVEAQVLHTAEVATAVELLLASQFLGLGNHQVWRKILVPTTERSHLFLQQREVSCPYNREESLLLTKKRIQLSLQQRGMALLITKSSYQDLLKKFALFE